VASAVSAIVSPREPSTEASGEIVIEVTGPGSLEPPGSTGSFGDELLVHATARASVAISDAFDFDIRTI
jgi:hypothetical protein